jgi:hypothetical protein
MSAAPELPPRENPFQPPAQLPPPRRSRSWLLFGAGGVLAVLCLSSGLCVVPMGLGVYQAFAERDDVEQVVSGFMSELGSQRFAEASERFSTRSQRVFAMTPEKLAEVAEDPAFQSSRAAHVAGVNLNRAFNTNADVPQGVVANVSGTIDYDGGPSGTFRATLEKERGVWKLHSIHVQRGASQGATGNP